jgi:carbon monoxide dehydrogenase subunit G
MKVTSVAKKTSAPYPKLMIDKSDNQVVLVLSDTEEAVTLIPGSNSRTYAGELYRAIDLSSFTDFDGEVTLTN